MAATIKIAAILVVRTTGKRARVPVSFHASGDHTQEYARPKRNVRKSRQKDANLGSTRPQNSPFYLICLSDRVELLPQHRPHWIAIDRKTLRLTVWRPVVSDFKAVEARSQQVPQLGLSRHGDRLEASPSP